MKPSYMAFHLGSARTNAAAHRSPGAETGARASASSGTGAGAVAGAGAGAGAGDLKRERVGATGGQACLVKRRQV